jgi:pyrrolidone-carboxylate peptidase
VLFVTGFGKFGKVLENPTTFLSKALPDLITEAKIENLNLHSTRVVTVSIEDCDEALEEIYGEINQLQEEDSAKPDSERRHVFVLHLGVYQGSGRFNLELQGRNLKDFGIPDERGNNPRN